MDNQPSLQPFSLSFLAGGGEMGTLIRSYDWQATALGTPETWPQPLRTALRLLLNTSHPMYIWWGPDLRCFYNDAYGHSIGPERHPHSLGRPATEVWDEIWPIIGPQIGHVVSGKGSVAFENALVPITRNGALEEVYWTYSYNPIDDENAPNGIGGVLVICTETTAQVVAARRAVDERQRFAELFDQSPTFMAMLRGAEHRFEFVNPRYRRLIGDRDVVGRTVAEALPDAANQGYVEILNTVYRTGEPYLAVGAKYVRQVTPGEPASDIYLDFVYQPIRDIKGTVTGIFVEGSDVTDRILANAALVASESRFRTLAENIPTLCWMADETGFIFWYNSRWYEYTGTSPEQMQGWGWQSVHDPEILPTVLERWRHSIANGTSFEMVFPLKSATGQFRPFLTRVVPSHNATGRIVGWFGTNTDISTQLEAEAALREADRRKDEFLATLAHELRNPLAPVRSAAKLLRVPAADAKTRDWAAMVIDRQVQTMASLLDDLLDVSKITRSQITLNKQRISLSSVIETGLEVANPLIDARHHTVRLLLPDPPLEIEVDPLRMSQVFSNLLTNAAKYTEPGGYIEVTAFQYGNSAYIKIKDSGIGLETESLTKIFELFSQVKKTMERSEGGLGIGLALVKGLVELHGGLVNAASEGIGQGSEFCVQLPLPLPKTVELAPHLDPMESPAAPMHFKKILVVDDNEDAASSLGLLLEASGHEVRLAHDGEQALSSATEFRPDIVLLDIGLPKLNGYAVAQAIRRQSWGEQIILIALTGWGNYEDKQRAIAGGFNFHVTKPVDPNHIEGLIQTNPQGTPNIR